MGELNFVQAAIQNGFVADQPNFNPLNNYFGVSVYHPDVILSRGNRKIIISLQGMAPLPKEKPQGYDQALMSGSIKYIGFYQDEVAVYESYFGKLPDGDFLQGFISPPPLSSCPFSLLTQNFPLILSDIFHINSSR